MKPGMAYFFPIQTCHLKMTAATTPAEMSCLVHIKYSGTLHKIVVPNLPPGSSNEPGWKQTYTVQLKVCGQQNYLIWVRGINHDRNAATCTQFWRYNDIQWQNNLPSLVTWIIQSWLGGKYSTWYVSVIKRMFYCCSNLKAYSNSL